MPMRLPRAPPLFRGALIRAYFQLLRQRRFDAYLPPIMIRYALLLAAYTRLMSPIFRQLLRRRAL